MCGRPKKVCDRLAAIYELRESREGVGNGAANARDPSKGEEISTLFPAGTFMEHIFYDGGQFSGDLSGVSGGQGLVEIRGFIDNLCSLATGKTYDDDVNTLYSTYSR